MQILLPLMLVFLVAVPLAGQDLALEEPAVRELWARFDELFNQGDAEGVAALYAPDADRTSSPGGRVARGRAEIQDMYAALIANRDANWEPPTTIRIRFVRPDVALLDGVARTAPGRVLFSFTVVMTKENGRWWIAAGRPRGAPLQR